MKRRLMLLACALALLAPAAPAFAQSCETHPAQRYAEREVLKPRHTAELAKVRFAAQALLMTESADPAKRLRGVADAGDTYEVVMERANERVTFSFRDEKNRAGTLSFFMPATIGIFEVDPRGEGGGEHPTLYKEWRLASHATGDGLFKARNQPQQPRDAGAAWPRQWLHRRSAVHRLDAAGDGPARQVQLLRQARAGSAPVSHKAEA